jgi:hypothetical protein
MRPLLAKDERQSRLCPVCIELARTTVDRLERQQQGFRDHRREDEDNNP